MSRHYEQQPLIEASGFFPYLQRFLEWTLVIGQSQDTAKRRQAAIRGFICWCDERDLQHPNQITKPILERYRSHLFYYRKQNGQPLSFGSQNSLLCSLKGFFKWLTQQNHILYNPASELDLPKKPRSLPKMILTFAQLETIFSQADLETDEGIRDRAIMELLYSSGMRRMELTHLAVQDINPTQRIVMIRKGKGGKDRYIPLGERALAWVEKYKNEVRPGQLSGTDNGTLFLTDKGEAFQRGTLTGRIKRYITQAGIEVQGSCHLFRHAMATHMLDNGADIRFIQAMLGHSNLNTTQIYTQVSIQKLREIHQATHPAKLKRQAESSSEND